jgi:apolipoprotein N-acyltransferase
VAEEPQAPPSLAPGRRLLLCAAAVAALLCGAPGSLDSAGLWPLGALFGALWSISCTRPGRWAFAIEWAAAALAFGALFYWLAYISWTVVLPTGVGMGLYVAVGGAAARRAARGLPPALAAALCFTAAETLRDWIEPPFGMGWLRLGHLGLEWSALAGGARVFGPEGVGLGLFALGAGLAQAAGGLVRGSRPAVWSGLLTALLVPGAVIAAGALVGAPRTASGPTVLLVQPNVAQARKQSGLDDRSILLEQVRLTREGLRKGPVDLVCWSETMLRLDLVAPQLDADAGLEFDPWQAWRGPAAEHFEVLRARERELVHEQLLPAPGRGGVLPSGTAFLAGAEEWRAVDGRLRRFNVGALWSASGARSTAGKHHLVPLGETTYGFERFAAVRDWMDRLAGYVPDLAADRAGGRLGFEDRDGRRWTFGLAVCFDNAFLDAYPPGVDFHVVLSNEAWYRDSVELDQMVAQARLAALANGRAVVRCTNSGISLVLDPLGEDVGRIAALGRDREVQGVLRATVPVPAEPARLTPYSAARDLVRGAFVALGLLAWWAGRRWPRT